MPRFRADGYRRFLTQRPYTARLSVLVSGAAVTLTFAPFGLWWLAPLALLPLLLTSLYSPPREAAGVACSFGAGLFLGGTYWLYISIHVFGQAPLWLAIGLMLALVLIMAAWYAAFGYLSAWLTAGKPCRLLLAAPAAWAAVEWLRGWVLSGFPWLSLGYSQLDAPLGGFIPVVGVYGVSLLLVASCSALVVAAVSRRRLLALLVAGLPWIGGALLHPVSWTAPAGEPQTVTLIQGGVPQDRKWLGEQFQVTLRLYRDGLMAAHDSDIVVWPEVAIPSLIERVEPYLAGLQRDVRVQHQSLLLGILERENDDIYNSVLLLDGRTRQIYRKRHLVPFGEYFPVPDFVREWMRLMSLPNRDVTAGGARQPLLRTRNGLGIAAAICYEDAYGAEQLYALPDAGLLVNVSNDAWFGDSIAPHQHLEIARVRAREAGRYVVRATNNGISAVIGPDGALLRTAPQFEYASLTHPVVPMQGRTPYARVGNWPVVSIALLSIAGLALRRTRD